MTSSIANPTSAAANAAATTQVQTDSSAAALGGATQSLGQDDFMKLLMAQIQNQDPMQPMDNTQFVSQLAQFSALSQQEGTNQLLTLQTTQNKGLANAADVALVGKNVTVDGSAISVDGQGLGSPVSFTLGANAQDVKMTITDSSGTAIRTVDLGAHTGGLVSTTWDGRSDAGVLQPAGSYTVSVSAVDSSGAQINVTQQTTATVTALAYQNGGAVLQLSNGVSAPTSELVSVQNATTSP